MLHYVEVYFSLYDRELRVGVCITAFKCFLHQSRDCFSLCSLWSSPTHLAAAGSSMHESRADHVLGEEVGVGVPADSVIDDGLPQALQPVGEVVCRGGKRREISVTQKYRFYFKHCNMGIIK